MARAARRGAYYNEYDKKAAAWLRELIKRGAIAPGVVDERSIEDVSPDDLLEFVQCHFFAGIGIWSYALRRAGWSDDRPIWTGSCPCQPFSASGQGKGFADERHLWPIWEWLIHQCKPVALLGEQAASKDGLVWLDLVSSDLEGQDYAFGATDICAAGVGAPHIRQRIFFCADRLGDADGARPQGFARDVRVARWGGGDGQTRTDQLPRQAYLCGWATPLRLDYKQSAGTGLNPRDLPRQAPLVGWPTPLVSNRNGGMESRATRSDGRDRGAGLHDMVMLTGWPTPMAGSPARNGNNQSGNTDSSRKTVEWINWGSEDGAARLTATGQMLTGSLAGMAAGGQFDPDHSRWLQGLPIVWDESAVTAMESMPKSRASSSKRQAKVSSTFTANFKENHHGSTN